MKPWTALERGTANLVRVSNRKINVFRTSTANTVFHEVAKLLIFLELRALGHNLIVEAIFDSKQGRCDILDLSDSTAIEIGYTEDKKQFELKEYPCNKIFLDAKEIVLKSSLKEVFK